MNYKQSYFASSNGMTGFHSYFNSVYNPKKLDKIYIIKGGPGTGKSTLIRSVGEEFEKKHNCEYFLCSSDKNSLDGLIIDNKIAIIDGTSPHATEALYPCAVEKIIDNAKSIGDGIIKRKKEIIALTEEKSKLYKSAYTYLKAIGELKKENLQIIASKMDMLKLDAAITRYFNQNIKRGNGYYEKIRLIEGITPSGVWNTRAYEFLSERKTIIVNGKGYEEIIYRRFLEKARYYGLETSVSFDPLIPYSPNALYFSNTSMSITNYNEIEHGDIDYDEYKVVNCERFIDKNISKELRGKLKFSSKCCQSLLNEATDYFSKASEVHKKLENIYYEYIDFAYLDENLYNVKKEISSLLDSN